MSCTIIKHWSQKSFCCTILFYHITRKTDNKCIQYIGLWNEDLMACTKHGYDLKIATATIAIKLIDLEIKRWSRWQLLHLKEGNYTLSLAFLHISPESADLNWMNRKGKVYRIMPYVRFFFQYWQMNLNQVPFVEWKCTVSLGTLQKSIAPVIRFRVWMKLLFCCVMDLYLRIICNTAMFIKPGNDFR